MWLRAALRESESLALDAVYAMPEPFWVHRGGTRHHDGSLIAHTNLFDQRTGQQLRVRWKHVILLGGLERAVLQAADTVFVPRWQDAVAV